MTVFLYIDCKQAIFDNFLIFINNINNFYKLYIFFPWYLYYFNFYILKKKINKYRLFIIILY